jgi:hypothetical protein
LEGNQAYKSNDLFCIHVIHIAVGDINAGENEFIKIKDLQQQFTNRPLWMAASIHRGEEEGKNPGPHLLLIVGRIVSSLFLIKNVLFISVLASCIKELLAFHISQ